jgi:thiol-disulfide isomerase/thioredoxin
MKKALGWVVLATVAVAAIAQNNGMSVVNSFAKTAYDAKTLKVNYTSQVIGGSPRQFNIELSKPNKARIESDSQLIVADGANIVTYDKKSKTYFKQPQNEAALMGLFKNEDISLWRAFFDGNFGRSVVSAKAMPNKTIGGQPLKVVQVAFDATGKTSTTMYIDNGNLLRRAQRELSDQGVNESTLLIMSNIAIGGDEGDYAFKAPEGSREISMEELNASKWYYNLDEAKKVAKATNRKIFVDFMASWCGPCKMLDRDVLQTEGFKAYGKQFVFLKIDVDEQPNVARAYNIEAMPTQMVLDAEGAVIGKTVGYGGAHAFYSWINQYR